MSLGRRECCARCSDGREGRASVSQKLKRRIGPPSPRYLSHLTSPNRSAACLSAVPIIPVTFSKGEPQGGIELLWRCAIAEDNG